MNVDAKILKEILASLIQHYIMRIINHDQVGFTLGMQRWVNIYKSINIIHHVNKMKNKSQTVISIDAVKTFEITQYPHMILKKL